MLAETLITPSTMASYNYTQQSHKFVKYLPVACFSHYFPEPTLLKSFYIWMCVCVGGVGVCLQYQGSITELNHSVFVILTLIYVLLKHGMHTQ